MQLPLIEGTKDGAQWGPVTQQVSQSVIPPKEKSAKYKVKLFLNNKQQ